MTPRPLLTTAELEVPKGYLPFQFQPEVASSHGVVLGKGKVMPNPLFQGETFTETLPPRTPASRTSSRYQASSSTFLGAPITLGTPFFSSSRLPIPASHLMRARMCNDKLNPDQG